MQTFDFSKLTQLIEINSWTKNKEGVDSNGNLMAQWMAKLGFELKRHERGHIGDHLHFVSPIKEGKRLLLLGHLDTVFPPLTFEEFNQDEEWIYGPGVCDMKGGNMIAFHALENIYREFGLISNIDMLLVSDEETGSDDSKFLTSKIAPDYDYCMVFEAAGQNGEVVEARKGVGTFFIDITGKAAHAGNRYVDGIDANAQAALMLLELKKLTNLEAQTTVNVGKIEGGIGANTISPHAKLTFELRYTSTHERDRVLKAIDAIVATSYVEGSVSQLSGGIQRDVMEANDAQRAFIAKINALNLIALPTERRGGVSDANIVSSCGVATLDGWGPFGDGDHTIEERASKKSFDERLALVSAIFRDFVNGKFDN
ncbi:MAG: M20 family metallopeptidase [Campylobacterales bacterium]|nr:M20 family metallopeptidase [Campylobacterales bacterium]